MRNKTTRTGVSENGKPSEATTVLITVPENRPPETLREKLIRDGDKKRLAELEASDLMSHHLDDLMGSSTQVAKFEISINGGVAAGDESLEGVKLQNQIVAQVKAAKKAIAFETGPRREVEEVKRA